MFQILRISPLLILNHTDMSYKPFSIPSIPFLRSKDHGSQIGSQSYLQSFHLKPPSQIQVFFTFFIIIMIITQHMMVPWPSFLGLCLSRISFKPLDPLVKCSKVFSKSSIFSFKTQFSNSSFLILELFYPLWTLPFLGISFLDCLPMFLNQNFAQLNKHNY